MKKFLLLKVFLFGLFLASNLHAQQNFGVLAAWQTAAAPVAEEFSQAENLLTARQLAIKPKYEVWLYEVATSAQALNLLAKLRANSQVVWAELNSPVSSLASSAPSYFPSLGLAATSLEQFPCNDFPISILDSGINTSHVSLQPPNLELDFTKNYVNPSQPSAIEDEQGHGTHIAGLIAAAPSATTANELVAGICNPAKLHIQRVIPKSGKGKVSDIYSALEDALTAGAASFPIINVSLDIPASVFLTEQLTSLNNQGQLVVAAAGNAVSNKAANINLSPIYPASLAKNLPLVVSVANFNQHAQVLDASSNFGYLAADLAAPGYNLLSTWLNSPSGETRFSYSSGTSMAAPLVSASLAALMQAYKNQNLPPVAFKAALVNSATQHNSLTSQLTHAGVLNLHNTLNFVEANIFKPTWLGIKWVNNAQAIEVFGYQLNAVTQVEFVLGNQVEELFFTYLPSQLSQVGADALVVDLPANWQAGRLVFTTPTGQLNPLHLYLAHADSQLASQAVCSQASCAINWQGYQLEVVRQATASNWWLSATSYEHQGRNYPAISIAGADLTADWQFNFSGRQGIDFSQLKAVNSQGELITLNAALGLQANAAASKSWLVEQPQTWSQLPEPLQQLILIPEVTSQVTSSSSSRCYIATSVYANPHATELKVLRDFRDKALLTHAPGRWLVNFYYKKSPAWVVWLEDKPRMQKIIKTCLDAWVKLWSAVS